MPQSAHLLDLRTWPLDLPIFGLGSPPPQPPAHLSASPPATSAPCLAPVAPIGQFCPAASLKPPRSALAAPGQRRPPRQPRRWPSCAPGDQDNDLHMQAAFIKTHSASNRRKIEPIPAAGRVITACTEMNFCTQTLQPKLTAAEYHISTCVPAGGLCHAIGRIEHCWHTRGHPRGGRSRRCRQLYTTWARHRNGRRPAVTFCPTPPPYHLSFWF